MLKKLLITASAVAAFAAPAHAINFVASYDSSGPIASNNNFRSNLNTLGYYNVTTSLSDLGFSASRAKITFYVLASEASFRDSFTATGTLEGAVSYTRPVAAGNLFNNFGTGGELIGSIKTTNTDNWLFTSLSALGAPAAVGDEGFGLFLKRSYVSGGSLGDTIYFAYDDQINNRDDNHDDLIIKAVISEVPEPATWLTMIAGFGMVGYQLRRRTVKVATTVA